MIIIIIGNRYYIGRIVEIVYNTSDSHRALMITDVIHYAVNLLCCFSRFVIYIALHRYVYGINFVIVINFTTSISLRRFIKIVNIFLLTEYFDKSLIVQ